MNWDEVRLRANYDQRTVEVVEATLKEAERRARAAQPAGNTRTTFEGGRNRVSAILHKMRDEIGMWWA